MPTVAQPASRSRVVSDGAAERRRSDAQRFRNPPAHQWTKVTMMAAVEGEYHP